MLARGLRTNMSLRQLHVPFCNLSWESGGAISDLLANSRSNLESINIAGNRLGGKGLNALCRGLMVNTKCNTLNLSDNMIDHLEDDMLGLAAFRDCLLCPTVALTSVDLMYNRIGEAGAQVLAAALTPENIKVKEFLVDLTLPMPLFELLYRKASGKGKKKGKGGGKKKKK